ncbi:MAG: diacylglycerol/lipid kinase family protein [Actinomycetota bacterium]
MPTVPASPFGSLAVIANPHAGKGRVGRELSALERGLAGRGLEYSLQVTDGPGDATRLATDAMDAGVRFLVAVGGDGTIHEVVNGMFRDGRPIVDDPVLGVVPAHSGCDLVKSFGLPGDVDAACGHLLGDNTYPFDVLKVAFASKDGQPSIRYSVNLAEVGFGAAVAARTAGRSGRARSFMAFWSAFARTRVRDVRIEADRNVYEGPAFNVVVGNAQFSSGGMRLSPRSFPGDGVADVLIFTGPRSDAYTLLPAMYRHGDHVPHPHIREMRAKIRVSIDAARPLPIVADGEPLGTTPATFQVVPRSILLKL